MRDRVYALIIGSAVAGGVSWHLTRLVAEQSALWSVDPDGRNRSVGERNSDDPRWKRLGLVKVPELVPFPASEPRRPTLERPTDLEHFLRRQWASTWNESVDSLLTSLQTLDLERLQRQLERWWTRWRQRQRNHTAGDTAT
ncbi:hypothetical protein F1559_000143 [Cyanidiococcus yangmingshanensis]|uniref:Uncharacterized protein n=1 Tax=Cyanidiococcus yangmingshanensis TaxID=2690220 RepID=A0A7J7IGD7_9RHOD|nr:hypothetical protein F1559_000143 [Cyanidiococcus yangmingshanensis]